MKRKQIAIITPGILPIPAVQGGAVETLIDFYLQENEKKELFHFLVYSIYTPEAHAKSMTYKCATFHFFKPQSIQTRIKRHLYKYTHPTTIYYNVYMEYYAHWAINHLSKNKIDLLIIENRQGIALQYTHTVAYPIMLHLHNDTLNQKSHLALEIANKYNKIITVSDYIKRQVDTINHHSETKVIYNGIEIERFRYPNHLAKREQYGLSHNDFVVVYAGRITEIKGIRELLQAFIGLKSYPMIKLLLIGSKESDADNTGRFATEIHELSQQLGKQIRYTGFIPYKDIPGILKMGDVSIVPSICEEAFSLSALESMAAGLPVIATRTGGIPEVVGQDSAIMVENDKDLVENIKKSILKLYATPCLRHRMSEIGQERSLTFDKNTFTSNFFEEIKRMCYLLK